MSSVPNIIYLHSHDTGRYVQPYGFPVQTPNIQRLADQGVLFRRAFCATPTCSGSRACLLTGQHAHGNGMLGLAHRGWALEDYSRHLVHTLREGGYRSALIGEQHISEDPAVIGYDRVVEIDSHQVESVVPATIELLDEPFGHPFFLSVGFFETHRSFFEPTSVRDALYSLPPANLPDTPETRRDIAAFKESARSLDHGVGAVLDAVDSRGLADDTIVLFTTDHGLAFPGAKATLFDRGLGVLMMMRGPGFAFGKVVDAMVSHLDVYPTLCDIAGVSRPPWLEGRSLLPLVAGEVDELHDELFSAVTYHAAYEPQRAVRTTRFKYIRRFDDRRTPVLPNTDDSPSKDVLVGHGWADRPVATEQLYDLVFDPNEAGNLAGDPAYAEVLEDLRERLEAWMRSTDDPLLDGDVGAPQGARANPPDQRSPSEPHAPVNGVNGPARRAPEGSAAGPPR
jgi:arylsulfatase A-like enzyme